MKNTLLTTAIAMALATTGAYAHHPAADRVDPEIYEMIDANVADTPHADLVFDDMGRDMDDVGDAMNSREDMDAPMESRDEMGEANESRSEAGEVSADVRGPWERTNQDNADAAADAADEAETIDLLENVVTAISD